MGLNGVYELTITTIGVLTQHPFMFVQEAGWTPVFHMELLHKSNQPNSCVMSSMILAIAPGQ